MRSLRILCPLLPLLIIVLDACKQEPPPEPPPQALELKIVHEPNVGEYLKLLLGRFEQRNPTLSDGRKIKISLQPQLGLVAAKLIASGKLKIDGWLTASRTLITFTNANLINLGAPQVECKTVFGTPIVFVGADSHSSYLGGEKNKLSVLSLFDKVLNSPRRALTQDRPFSLIHTDLLDSSTGISELLQLAHIVAHTSALSEDQIPQIEAGLKSLEQLSFAYPNDALLVHELSLVHKSQAVRLGISTEQQAAKYNLLNANGRTLLIYYPEEGSVWEQYTHCRSDGDWVTADKRAGLNMFFDFLDSAEAQHEAKLQGFRPSLIDTPAAEILSTKYGVDLNLPEKSFGPVSPEILKNLVDSWPKLLRPSATVFVMDLPGEERPAPSPAADATLDPATLLHLDPPELQLTKDYLRSALAILTDRDQAALISVANRTNVEVETTPDRDSLITKLNGLRSLGGSSVHDGIVKAYQLITVERLADYRKNVFVFIHRHDTASETTSIQLSSILRNSAIYHDINLIVVAESNPNANYGPLREAVHGVQGVFKEIPAPELDKVISEIAKNLL